MTGRNDERLQNPAKVRRTGLRLRVFRKSDHEVCTKYLCVLRVLRGK